MSESLLNVRIVSYNLLSSQLAQESHFVSCTRDALTSKQRGPRLLAKLDEQIAQHPNSVLCLQEVSHSWAGLLHAHLAQRRHHLVVAHYGERFNGHMGVAMSYPIDLFELVDCTVRTVAETRDLYKAPAEPSRLVRAMRWLIWLITLQWLIALVVSSKSGARDPYEYAMARKNDVIVLRLRCRKTSREFVVATYHMPCAFLHPQMMSLHSSLVLQFVDKQAGSLPYVLAGDFNFTPAHDQYTLYTTGTIAEGRAGRPPPPPAIAGSWKFDVTPVRSAYAVAGGEPQFTNWAQIKEEPEFRDTLDYVWISKHWSVDNVQPLNVSKGPLPTVEEPSDHLLVAASLTFDGVRSNKKAATSSEAAEKKKRK
jgi:2',5'-phosphodiesterase